VAQHKLRKSITVIPQDPFILAGTIRQNVDIAGKKSDAEIWAALEAVQVSRLDFICPSEPKCNIES
jgi:ABC-type multidrug transport system fused ATPase/permease subunit